MHIVRLKGCDVAKLPIQNAVKSEIKNDVYQI